jgi:hypothetical protein
MKLLAVDTEVWSPPAPEAVLEAVSAVVEDGAAEALEEPFARLQMSLVRLVVAIVAVRSVSKYMMQER